MPHFTHQEQIMTSHRRKLSVAVLLSLLLIAALPWSASAQSDTEDPADPDFLLSILEDGESIESVFEDTVTAELFAFYGTAGDEVSITMIQADDSDLDPYLVVLGSAGQLIAIDDDSGETSLSAAITDLELPVDGIYLIIASSFDYINAIGSTEPLEEAQAFTISLTGATMPGEESTQYFSSRLELGDSHEGYSTEDEPVYYYTLVSLEEAVAIDVAVASDDFDTLVMVFGPGGGRIAVNDDNEQAEGTDSAVFGLELTEPGKYLIFATDVAFPNVGDDEAELEYTGGDFTISVTAAE
ncbi:MAG: hypothetical protein IPK52_24960 [Chloroflexi bacterium]|nr:hypothetical protein [Chloroflexota bacterium]